MPRSRDPVRKYFSRATLLSSFWRSMQKEGLKNRVSFLRAGKNIIPNRKKNSISEELVAQFDVAFKKYERLHSYTNSTFDKAFIKKDTGINDHYISDYLRDYIGCSISTYINNKRVELAIEKIINDKNFPKYTMQAMAEELGYKNAETFRNAFKARTGVRPLEFLKKLKIEKR